MAIGTWRDVATADRVLCYGVTGSGKSTLAARLSESLGHPLTLIDELCWDPGWTPVPADAQVERMLPRLHADAWIVDSVYAALLEPALECADVIVALDYPRWLSLWRLVRRTTTRWRTRESVCNGNIETLGQIFSRDSILLWHFRSFVRKQSRMREWYADPTAPPVVLLRRPADAEALLTALSDQSAG